MKLNIPYLPLHHTNQHSTSSYLIQKLKYLCRRRSFIIVILSVLFSWILFVNYNTFIFTILYCVSYIRVDSIIDYLQPVNINTVNTKIPLCPLFVKQNILYDIDKINKFNETLYDILPKKLNINKGGHWEPSGCIAQHEVAIIIPYSNREKQLHVFLSHIHGFLQKQYISYRIFIIEQSNSNKLFNRGKLLNIGYTESLKIKYFNCFIFHDVDLIPTNPNNIYACTIKPRHMSVSINTFDYELPYCTIFGGAISILNKQFKKINGFSNLYFGWGAEDDDFFQRLNKYYSICRFDKEISKYEMLNHVKEVKSKDRIKKLEDGYLRHNIDGLNSLISNYTVTNYTEFSLYTKITVDL